MVSPRAHLFEYITTSVQTFISAAAASMANVHAAGDQLTLAVVNPTIGYVAKLTGAGGLLPVEPSIIVTTFVASERSALNRIIALEIIVPWAMVTLGNLTHACCLFPP